MPTLYTKRLTVIIPLHYLGAANAFVKANLDIEGGEDTFGPPTLSADGVAPGTHSWCSAAMKEDSFHQALAAITTYFPEAKVKELDNTLDNYEANQAFLAENNLQLINEEPL